MNVLKNILCSAALCSGMAFAQTSETYTVSGVILNDQLQPVADAIVSCPGHGLVRTEADGKFELKDVEKWVAVRVQAQGFYNKEFHVVENADNLNVYLIGKEKRQYNQTVLNGMADNSEGVESTFGTQNIAKKDLSLGAVGLDKAIQGQFTGLQVTQKSGMTGEGSNLQWRGIRSFVAETNPLIVINGVPYMPDLKESSLIQGYSRSIFQTINPQDIANVTLLSGAETAAWGSLGSNGVLLIETDGAKSDDLNTRVSFTGSFGLNWQTNKLPLMNASAYKSYLSDIAMDYYKNDMGAFFSDFGFMSSASANMAHLYAFDTDWQDKIYSNSATHDYLFRVEGGDAIAKYDIALGYTGDKGTLTDTKSDRFHAQINANVLVSKKWELNANINLAYLNGSYQEQGYSLETNPLLAAYRRSPLLSPYQSSAIPSEDGTYALINKYSSYYMGSVRNTDFIVTNPVSLVNTVDGSVRQYDMNARVQAVYKPTTDWTIAATVGLYSNFDKEKLFVPGKDNSDIVPRFDNYGKSENTVKVGEATVFNLYYGANARYQHTWNRRHALDARAGFQVIQTKTEYDMATGRNTANDYYQTMGDTQSIGKYIDGYNNKWNWLNGYMQANYTFGNLVRAGLVASIDGASSVGADAKRISVYPGVNAGLMLANWKGIRTADWLDRLDVFADYSMTGNSRFSSKYGQYYYTSQPYQTIAGIVRANVPNTDLKTEKDYSFQAGIDMAWLQNRFGIRATYFNTRAKDVLMLGRNSSALGTSPYYCNDGEILSRGLEMRFSVVPVRTRNWIWTLNVQTTHVKNSVESLGALSQFITTLSDGGEIISRVGENPYAFYGYRTQGVYSTTAEATAAGLVNRNGVAYKAGDICYEDINHDGIINDADKVVLGSSTPDIFGSVFTSLQYKGWALDLNFVFSDGNEAYNATRRITESSSDFANQSKSVMRRWQNEGDVTDMPRANYGDVIGNNEMSDRFVEDASYLKLRDVTLSYTWNKKLWNIIRGGSIYISGQNLVCISHYLGSDPEFAYSNAASMMGVDYGKVALPKSVKIGVNLQF